MEETRIKNTKVVKMKVSIIGGGLAGCEAAFQIAKQNIEVDLYEMRPEKMTPAHQTGGLAELVCSNSFKGTKIVNAHGLLKEELRLLGSTLIKTAEETSVPAGGALAVDREKFSKAIEHKLEKTQLITLKRECVTHLIQGPLIIATGPLTDSELWETLRTKISDQLFFFDAVAPVVNAESIDMKKAFFGSRYDFEKENAEDLKGDYINCPMNKDEYEEFYHSLVKAERVEVKEFEKKKLFEGCMPIEEMADRGIDTIRFGPMKPVGFVYPGTDKQPYAVVQLRQDNITGTLYNMVGFQTRLKFGEQKRIFQLIPGFENASFERYGVMHRNSYLNSPEILDKFLFFKNFDQPVMAAGQITGVEGYVESIATGLLAGINMARTVLNIEKLVLPSNTMLGSLIEYISGSTRVKECGMKGKFSPMPANFGLMPPVKVKSGAGKKARRKEARAQGSLEAIRMVLQKNRDFKK